MRYLFCLLGVFSAASVAEPLARSWDEPLTGMPFVHIGKACFRMGTSAPLFKLNSQILAEVGYGGDFTIDERPEHEVCVGEFWMGKYEVRADEWVRVMQEIPPVGTGSAPASGVSWYGAVRFAERLTVLSGGKSIFRLPTEAEWEMACLAGQAELVKTASDWRALAPYAAIDPAGRERRLRDRPQAVGSKSANPWGLYDMRGNVWEWVSDSYSPTAYTRHSLFDPLERNGRGEAVVRGGGYRSEAMHYRCAKRGAYPVSAALPTIGFRLVRVAVQ